MLHRASKLMSGAGAALCLTLAATALVAAAGSRRGEPTVAEARAFTEEAEDLLLDLGKRRSRAEWVQANFITQDTETIAAEAARTYLAASTDLAFRAARYRTLDLPHDLARKLLLLQSSLTLAAPPDADEQAELAELQASMESRYGRGKHCRPAGECLDINRLGRILAESRDPAELLEVWLGWRDIAPPMRPQYRRFVELANKGAGELGYDDLGLLWRSGYDMPPEAFAAEMDRLWKQVKPLYDALHCHVRAALSRTYGPEVAPGRGAIPAHLLGNMWAQSWSNVYELVKPPAGDPGFDLTRLLQARDVDAVGMVKHGERFFTSLGFDPLPATFWERSLFVKPADREVQCHASAWNIDAVDDLRIKMCIEITGEDFDTIHHELGHNFYQRAYNGQPPLFREGANDGFHEGIGDTLALSVTPEYLVRIGLLDKAPPPEADLGLLMKMALDRVAFLPFGLLVDQWRWRVFSGDVPPERYNRAWWELVLQRQGVEPPVPRSEEQFDAGAKYHVPANTPYARYFLAGILQFQFHRALCEAAGYDGPLHRCSIYGNQEAGRRLRAMMQMGASRPWMEAMAALSGGDGRMDATAMLDYFAPLKAWLDQQNSGRVCGW